MTVLVTGGSGVVGRAVVRHLVREDRDVRGLARSAKTAAILSDLGAQPVRGDILDPESLLRAATGCEVVYHVAGLVSFCPTDPSSLYRINVDGTRNVVRAARKAGTRRLIHTSSVAALGETPGTIGTESTTHSGTYYSHYARSKHQGELIAREESGSVEVVVVNPASVQGAGRVTGSGGLLLQAARGQYKYLVDVPISIVDTEDCAAGHLAAEQHGQPDERYILSGFTMTTGQACNVLFELTGTKYPIRFVPRPLIGMFGPLSNLVGGLVRSAPICRETVHLMRYGASYDGSRATKELGITYRPPKETFAGALESFRQQGLL